MKQQDTGSAAESLRRQLVADGCAGPQAELTPLTGGVSSDIFLITDGDEQFVAKRAKSKLAVEQDWYADTSRNVFEHRYIEVVGRFRPTAVPRVLFQGNGYFTMEYLGGGFQTWKNRLLEARFDSGYPSHLGKLLGTIHAETLDDQGIRDDFDSTPNFHQLRVDPYLLTLARRFPEAADWIEQEAERLEATRECLVHGDFSPKNILVSPERVVIVDCEVAWFGDPSFDLAFLVNHLLLKALYHEFQFPELKDHVSSFLTNYRAACTRGELAARERNAGQLLLLLLWARVDGKSPVEYLDSVQQDRVREFVQQQRNTGFQGDLEELSRLWFDLVPA